MPSQRILVWLLLLDCHRRALTKLTEDLLTTKASGLSSGLILPDPSVASGRNNHPKQNPGFQGPLAFYLWDVCSPGLTTRSFCCQGHQPSPLLLQHPPPPPHGALIHSPGFGFHPPLMTPSSPNSAPEPYKGAFRWPPALCPQDLLNTLQKQLSRWKA